MAFFLNNHKLKRLIFNAARMNSCYCNKKKVLNSEVTVKARFKTSELSDRFNNTIIWEQTYDDGIDHYLGDFLDPILDSGMFDRVPWNRYDIKKYEYENGNEAFIHDYILENTIINISAKRKDVPVYFVDVPHVTKLSPNFYYPYNETAKVSTFLQNNNYIKYDVGYMADGDPEIEELIISEDGKTESWMPARNIQMIDGVPNILCVNPLRITLKAKPKEYVVTFNGNGRGNTTTSKVNYGSKVAKPANPTATGYTFGGWYTDSGCTKAFDFNTAITGNITLYAKWTVAQCTVTYDFAGRAKNLVTKVNYGSETSVPASSLPDIKGYSFRGCFTTKAYAQKWNFHTPITKDIILYCKYTKDYIITWDTCGRSIFRLAYGSRAVGADNGNKQYYGATEEMIGIMTPVMYDKTNLIGWYTPNGTKLKEGSFNMVNITGDTTIRSRWK